MVPQGQLAAMANIGLRREIGKLLHILTIQGQTQTDIELNQLEQAAILAGIMEGLGISVEAGITADSAEPSPQETADVTAEGGAADVADSE